MNEIRITELISGGSAWRQNKLQVGDIILKSVRKMKMKQLVF